MQIVGGKKCMLATPVIGDCGRIWIVIAHELDSWCEPLTFFFLLFLNICSQSNLCSFFDYFSFCKRCGAVLRTESNPLQPRQSGWNVTTVLFIWASHFFLDISKVFLISILNLVLKANLYHKWFFFPLWNSLHKIRISQCSNVLWNFLEICLVPVCVCVCVCNRTILNC